jgi:hypothetical protein
MRFSFGRKKHDHEHPGGTFGAAEFDLEDLRQKELGLLFC